MGASIHTYNFLPAEPGISAGTSTPQSRSLVMALACKPPSSHDLHCPTTWFFHFTGSWCSCPSSFPVSIQAFNQTSCLSRGRYQWLVFFNTGLVPVSVDLGFTRSVGLRLAPHCSH